MFAGMSSTIWTSDIEARTEAQSAFGFWRRADAKPGQMFPDGATELSDVFKRIRNGEPFSDGEYPKRLVWDDGNAKPYSGKVPAVFTSGFIFLRHDVAEVFFGFDLGDATLVPFDLYEQNNATKIDVKVFALVSRSRRRTIDLDSPNLRKVRYSNPPKFGLPFEPDAFSDLKVLDATSRNSCQWPVWMAPALQAIFVGAMFCQYSRVSGLLAWRLPLAPMSSASKVPIGFDFGEAHRRSTYRFT